MYGAGHSRILSTGISLPEQRVSSREVMELINSQANFGLSFDWLERVTGIQERRVADAGQKPSDLATKAALDALERAKVLPGEVDAIIYAGVIRDHLEPATAHLVQHKLGACNAIALDVSNACLGFMNAVHLMDALIATGQVRRGLVVTGEKGFSYTMAATEELKKTQRREVFDDLVAGLTLGDAGAAMLLGPKIHPDSGILGFMVHSQGEFHDLCVCGDETRETPLRTNITKIVAETAKLVGPLFVGLMGKLKWQNQDVKRYVPHQVGLKSIRIHAGITGFPLDLIPVSVDRLGNVVSATIPVNLHFLQENKELAVGDKVYLSGTGSGICLAQAGVVWDVAA
jgi:3-oxoacyl-[acyl-carrier-protein] synthase-3